MNQHRLSRRHALKALGYGSLLALSACANDNIRFVTITSAANPASATPSSPPLPTSAPPATATPEPSATPEPTSAASATPETSLFQPLGRPARALGFHVPYSFLESPIDYAAFEALIRGTGANCVVIDIKDEAGKIAIPFDHLLKPGDANRADFNHEQVGALVNWLVERQIYPIARQVVMTDTPLVAARPELGYHFYSPQLYRGPSGELWLDPERPEVGDYNAAIAVAAAQLGFPEVQLDYVRFPEANFDMPIERRVGAIFNMLATVRAALGQQALLTIDVLDDSTNDYPDNVADGGYGQRIATLAQTVDGVCPMLYPDLHHQNIDVDYYQNVHDGTLRTIKKVAAGGSTAFVNPWIQAYYAAGLERIRQQAVGAFDANAVGVYAWNIGLNYPYGMYGPAL